MKVFSEDGIMFLKKVPHRDRVIDLINTVFPKEFSSAVLSVVADTFIYRLLYADPYLDVFDKYRCIFVHIPKCAGISIENGLFGTKVGHKRITLFERYNAQKFNEYFKFTFVRNPYDRIVSAFFFLKSGGRNEKDREWAAKNLNNCDNFRDFVLNWLSKENIEKALHLQPQYLYLCKPGSLIPMVDFIGRFENIDNDFKYIQDQLGIHTGNLPHLNRSDREDDYRHLYDQETRSIVADVYEEDLSIFDYGF